MATVPLTGITLFSIGGQAYSVVGSLTFRTASVKRESMSSMTSGFDGFKETPIPGVMAVKLRMTPDDSLSDFDNMTGVIVVAQLANGQTISGYNMVLTEAPEYDASEATIDVHFEGPTVSVD